MSGEETPEPGPSGSRAGSAVATADAPSGRRPRPGRKTVEESRVAIHRLMRPQHANFADNVHGGVLLGLMDEAAYLCASSYAEAYCVTVRADGIEFHDPVRVGDKVSLEAAVHATGTSSMEVGIEVTAEDPQEPGTSRRTTRSFFTMVALDREGGTVAVPDLVCETAEDRRLGCEAELRRELRAEFRRRLDRGVCELEAS